MTIYSRNSPCSRGHIAVRAVVSFLLASLALLNLSAAETPPRLPVEAFLGAPEFQAVKLSPDGKYISFLTTLGTGHVGIALMNVETGKLEPLVVAKDYDYTFYLWKGPNRVVFGGDFGGNESVALRMIRLNDRRVVELAQSYRPRYATADGIAIANTLPLDPTRIVIFGGDGLYDLNVETGRRSKLEPAFDVFGVERIGVDNRGIPRFRQRRVGPTSIMELRANDHAAYTPVAEQPRDAAMLAPTWAPEGFASDNDRLFVITRNEHGAERLRTFIASTGQFAAEPDYDVPGSFDGLVLSHDRSRLLGVYYDTDRPAAHWFDAQRADMQSKLDAALPGTINRIVSSTDDEQMHIVEAVSDRQPPVFFLLNLKPGTSRPLGLSVIGRASSKLDARVLAEMRPITYTARDGLLIHGYLTVPVGYKSGTRIPLVVLPHGGPYGIRDTWGYDPEVQLYANRGYAVLQPNYRGSGGYGFDFLLAGRHEWGGKMQDDLTDGVRWAIAQGIADPKRVAIVGASYGGYAALAGVTLTPDLYCCAVNYVGVSDLRMVANWVRPGDPDHVYQKFWIGDDKGYIAAHSPVDHVENIRVPTLHAYGENDPRVDIDNWHRLKAELDRHHKPYEIVDEPDEGHGFRSQAARVRFFRRVDMFLARYLGGTTPTTATQP